MKWPIFDMTIKKYVEVTFRIKQILSNESMNYEDQFHIITQSKQNKNKNKKTLHNESYFWTRLTICERELCKQNDLGMAGVSIFQLQMHIS